MVQQKAHLQLVAFHGPSILQLMLVLRSSMCWFRPCYSEFIILLSKTLSHEAPDRLITQSLHQGNNNIFEAKVLLNVPLVLLVLDCTTCEFDIKI